MNDILEFFEDNSTKFNFKINSLITVILNKLKTKKQKQQHKYLNDTLIFVIKNWIDDIDIQQFFIKKIQNSSLDCTYTVIIKTIILELNRQLSTT
jgi:hypothetical protein